MMTGIATEAAAALPPIEETEEVWAEDDSTETLPADPSASTESSEAATGESKEADANDTAEPIVEETPPEPTEEQKKAKAFDDLAASFTRDTVGYMRATHPLLTPEQTLRIGRLPQGQDPDSLVRSGGPAAFQAVLDGAQPLAEALFAMLREGARTPEQLAAFRGRLESAARSVAHPALAAEYRRALLDRFYAERRTKPVTRTSGAPVGRPALSADQADADRFRLLAALLLNHPTLLHDEAETVAHLDFTAPLRPLIRAMLDWLHAGSDLEAKALMDHLRASGAAEQADALLASVAAILPAGARAGAMPADAWEVFWHYVGLLRRTLLDEQIARAEQELCVRFDEPGVQRLMGLCAAKSRLYAAEFTAT